MKEKIKVTKYAQKITEALPKGILPNTKAEKFNSMVIGCGRLLPHGQPGFPYRLYRGDCGGIYHPVRENADKDFPANQDLHRHTGTTG